MQAGDVTMWTAVAIVVHVMLSFDPSIHSKVIRRGAPTEAQEIWRRYGVDLAWDGEQGANLCVAAFVNRSAGPIDTIHPAVMGSTVVSSNDARPPSPIRIGFDAVDTLAEPTETSNPMLHEYAVAAAIGRVLAHEIGHILLGAPTYHDATGLMRPKFLSDDFSHSDRWRFELADRSVERLRTRVAEIETTAATGCPVR
jgi:hypothetical protein